MTTFDRIRLTNEIFKLDLDRMRQGWYSDKYFENIEAMLSRLAAQGYRYSGRDPRVQNGLTTKQLAQVETGNLEVEMQWFTRRPGKTVVVGVDKALAMLRGAAGDLDEMGRFVERWPFLQVEAVHDGDVVAYTGDPLNIMPVIRVRGRYRDFALLETPTLGILTRASRVATNVYDTLVAARGKPVLFFPARFDLHEVQAADGYAYNIAVQRFNHDFQGTVARFVSTDAQGDWWGGAGGGTVAHAAIACFFGDTAEVMLAFASTRPPQVPRIALVDFNNDSVGDSLTVLNAMFARFREYTDAGDTTEAEKFRLYGVRLDTGGSVRDINVPPLGDPSLDLGVNPRLCFIVRQALNSAWESWNLPLSWKERAREYCRQVKIVVSGGFNPEKITRFERLNVPVDIYAVGSSLFDNHGPTVTDFTADVVQVKVGGDWHAVAKVGRRACENDDLEPVV
jgi:nicotinate phosphoribosyltransferase